MALVLALVLARVLARVAHEWEEVLGRRLAVLCARAQEDPAGGTGHHCLSAMIQVGAGHAGAAGLLHLLAHMKVAATAAAGSAAAHNQALNCSQMEQLGRRAALACRRRERHMRQRLHTVDAHRMWRRGSRTHAVAAAARRVHRAGTSRPPPSDNPFIQK